MVKLNFFSWYLRLRAALMRSLSVLGSVVTIVLPSLFLMGMVIGSSALSVVFSPILNRVYPFPSHRLRY